MFYTTNNLRHSTYPCTPSGKQNQVWSLDFAQFVLSASFFLSPKKELQKNLRFFTAPFRLFSCSGLFGCYVRGEFVEIGDYKSLGVGIIEILFI